MKRSAFKAATVGAMASAGMLGCGSTASADTAFVLAKSILYQQTGPTTVVGTGAGVSAAAVATAGQYDTATMAYSGPSSPLSLLYSATPVGDFFQTSLPFPSQAAMDTAFPFGAYTFTLSNSGTLATATGTLDYAADNYPSVAPIATPATFATLSHLGASPLLQLEFNTFDPSPGAESFAGFFVVNSADEWVGLGICGLNGGQCSASLALTPGESYTWEVDFGESLETVLPDGDTTTLDFVYETSGTGIAAGAPEASTWVMLLAGFAGLGLSSWRFSRKTALPAG